MYKHFYKNKNQINIINLRKLLNLNKVLLKKIKPKNLFNTIVYFKIAIVIPQFKNYKKKLKKINVFLTIIKILLS